MKIQWNNRMLVKYTLVDAVKSTTKDPSFKQAPIKTSSVRGCTSLPM
jgi:hypothetical protein